MQMLKKKLSTIFGGIVTGTYVSLMLTLTGRGIYEELMAGLSLMRERQNIER